MQARRPRERRAPRRLGHLGLHAITPPVIAKWQVAVLPSGHEALVKARGVLSTILQSATEAGVIATNPVRGVRAPRAPLKDEVRPLAPVSIEALRAVLSNRDAVLVALLGYAGLRPGRHARCGEGRVLTGRW